MRLTRIVASCSALALSIGVVAAPGLAATTTAPVIHEKFTVLPCPSKPTMTTQVEGCAEHRVLATDKAIDLLNAKIFTKLGKSGRAAFIDSNADWVGYRDAACTADASIYSGGSVQPVAYADCLLSIDGSHVRELKGMLVALSPAG